MLVDGEPFVPGNYWTRERADIALQRMRDLRDSPQMQALMRAIGESMSSEANPAELAARLSGVEVDTAADISVERAACVFRRGREADVASLGQLIASGELPPFFIEPFVDGFLVIEHKGRLVGCGGNEHYGDSAVIRSVVVNRAARGLGLGLEIGRLLLEDARVSGARDLYLFTMDAYRFWKRFGFDDIPLDAWKPEPREQWQYRFMEEFPVALSDIHVMWRAA